MSLSIKQLSRSLRQPLPTNQAYYLRQKLKALAEAEEFVNDPKQCGFGIGVLHVPPQRASDLPA